MHPPQASVPVLMLIADMRRLQLLQDRLAGIAASDLDRGRVLTEWRATGQISADEAALLTEGAL